MTKHIIIMFVNFILLHMKGNCKPEGVYSSNISPGNCTSRVTVIEEKGNVRVKFFPGHNHELKFQNVKFHPLRKSCRETIKYLAALGVPVEKIQSLIRDGSASRNKRESRKT